MPTDYAQTTHAQRNRLAKAERLSVRAAELGHQPYELTMPAKFGTLADDARRERIRKDLGLRTRPSDQTWTMALDLLEVASRAQPGTSTCHACGWAVLAVKTAKGDRREIDPFAHPAGTVLPRRDGDRTIAVIITGDTTPPEGVPLFRQHSRSCPETRQAAERRRREAPRCDDCKEPRDGYLALVLPELTIHPTCTERR